MPVSVTRRLRLSRRRTSAISRSRPTKLVSAGTRLCRGSSGAWGSGTSRLPVRRSRYSRRVSGSGSVPYAARKSSRSCSYRANASDLRPIAACRRIRLRTARSWRGSAARACCSASSASASYSDAPAASFVAVAAVSARSTRRSQKLSRSSSRGRVAQSSNRSSGSRSPVYAATAERRSARSPLARASPANCSKRSTSVSTRPPASSETTSSRNSSNPSIGLSPASARRATCSAW